MPKPLAERLAEEFAQPKVQICTCTHWRKCPPCWERMTSAQRSDFARVIRSRARGRGEA